MAKFGQGFLTSLTRPSYLDSLGKTGMMIGQMPGQVIKDRRERDLMEQFANADPSDQAQILKTKAIQNRDFGLLTQATKMEKQLKQNETRFQGNNLLERLGNPQTTQVQADAITQQLLADYRQAGMDDTQLRKAIAIANNKRLTGNSAERESIVNAHRVRAGEMVKAGNSYEDFAAIAGPNFSYLWEEAVDAKANKDKNELQAEGQENINLIKGLMAKETDPVKLAKLQQKLEDESKRTGNFGPDIVGLGDQRIRQLEQARIDAAERQQALEEERRENMVTGIVNGMFETGSADIPKYVKDIQGNAIEVPEDVKSDVIKRYNKEKKDRDALEAARQQGILPSNYIDIVNDIMTNNPEFIENAPKLDASLQILENNKPPEGKEPSKIYRNAAEYVATTVNAYKKQQRAVNLNDDVIRRRVEKMMGEYVLNVSTGAPRDWGGADLVYTVLTDSDYAEEKELLIKNMITEIKQAQGGKIPWRELVDRASDGVPRLQRLMEGEQGQRRREDEAVEKMTSRSRAINRILTKMYPNHEGEYTIGQRIRAEKELDKVTAAERLANVENAAPRIMR